MTCFLIPLSVTLAMSRSPTAQKDNFPLHSFSGRNHHRELRDRDSIVLLTHPERNDHSGGGDALVGARGALQRKDADLNLPPKPNQSAAAAVVSERPGRRLSAVPGATPALWNPRPGTPAATPPRSSGGADSCKRGRILRALEVLELM